MRKKIFKNILFVAITAILLLYHIYVLIDSLQAQHYVRLTRSSAAVLESFLVIYPFVIVSLFLISFIYSAIYKVRWRKWFALLVLVLYTIILYIIMNNPLAADIQCSQYSLFEKLDREVCVYDNSGLFDYKNTIVWAGPPGAVFMKKVVTLPREVTGISRNDAHIVLQLVQLPGQKRQYVYINYKDLSYFYK